MNGLLNETRRYRQRFLVSRGDELVVVNVDDIYYFAIEDNRVQAFTNEGQAYTLTLTMNDLEQELDPDSFFQNQSSIHCQHKRHTQNQLFLQFQAYCASQGLQRRKHSGEQGKKLLC